MKPPLTELDALAAVCALLGPGSQATSYNMNGRYCLVGFPPEWSEPGDLQYSGGGESWAEAYEDLRQLVLDRYDLDAEERVTPRTLVHAEPGL